MDTDFLDCQRQLLLIKPCEVYLCSLMSLSGLNVSLIWQWHHNLICILTFPLSSIIFLDKVGLCFPEMQRIKCKRLKKLSEFSVSRLWDSTFPEWLFPQATSISCWNHSNKFLTCFLSHVFLLYKATLMFI